MRWRRSLKPPASATAGTAFSPAPAVQLVDTFGNVVTTDSGTVVTATRNAGTASLQGTTTASTVNGVAGTLRPDVSGPVSILGRADAWFDTSVFTPVARFGNLGRNVLRLNPLINADMTLGKDFKITERLSTRLQWQVFNVFNNTTFNLGGISWRMSGPATFGYYEATDTNSRNMLLTLRFLF